MIISSASSTQELPYISIKWKNDEFDYFNPYPSWSCEPEAHEVVELLKEVASPLVEYHSSPRLPGAQTQSEVATMRWTNAKTRLPLPDVVQNLYSVSTNNPLGCEWILMSKVPGRPLFQCWRDMDLSRKRRVVEQLAEYTETIFNRGLDGIGCLYPAAADDPDQSPEFGGMEACMPYFWNKRYYKRPRCGPYETYREWAFDRLNLAYADAESLLPKLENIHIRKIPWRILAVITKLKGLHDVLFPSAEANKKKEGEEVPKGVKEDEHIDLDSDGDRNNNDGGKSEPEPFKCEEKTMMWHTNLSTDNIFVDDTGVITGILDWECISAIPRSVGCQLPAFLLEGHDRRQEPHIKDYWTFSDTLPDPQLDDDDGGGGERRGRPRQRQQRVGPTPDYWHARREWELTHLRLHFEMTMAARSLGWHMCYKHHALKRDFETAVQYCDDSILVGVVEAWISAVEAALKDKTKREKKGNEAGGEPMSRRLKVWSLERRIASGRKAPAGHN
ncbi:hypothetical protein PG994_000555 [Apiospora phragmitis]|uniref:Aminoglycoside phosphotransferase domain-containing protein n=1 Tax=Apiospora phragmitis TaxID=2905665 RepID=A0ABR1X6J1_9PEZI